MRRSWLPLAVLFACNPKTEAPPTVAPEPEAVAEAPEADGEDEVDPEAAAAAAREKELQRKRNEPPPAGLSAGLVSDFESGELRSEFGAGWTKASDEMEDGASTAELEVVADGPDGSPNALKIRATIDGSSANPWAGAMFFPGNRAMAPANLISKPTVTFHARGDGPLVVMVFAEQLEGTPARTTVEIGEEWGRYEVDMRTLVPEPYDITAIVFGAPPTAGTWEQWVDDVRLK
ncbi:MAG: hypothetical protein AAF799_09040 [Myxococcota bacterium]